MRNDGIELRINAEARSTPHRVTDIIVSARLSLVIVRPFCRHKSIDW